MAPAEFESCFLGEIAEIRNVTGDKSENVGLRNDANDVARIVEDDEAVRAVFATGDVAAADGFGNGKVEIGAEDFADIFLIYFFFEIKN
jgi:hypothetical protein